MPRRYTKFPAAIATGIARHVFPKGNKRHVLGGTIHRRLRRARSSNRGNLYFLDPIRHTTTPPGRLPEIMPRIRLLAQTPDHFRALLEGADVYERRFGIRVAEGVRDFLVGPEVSAEFLERLNGPAAPDPWKDGFAVVHVADKT